jgi:hypothetical protein
MKKFVLGVLAGIVLGAAGAMGFWWYMQLTAKPPVMLTMTAAERQFQQTLTGAELTGSTAPLNGGQPADDGYSVVSADKLAGDKWRIVARVLSVLKIPLELDVKWAGDTPVITLSNLEIPGIGTYSARVLIFEGHYSGVWSGGGQGGYVWGKIDHPTAASRPATTER